MGFIEICVPFQQLPNYVEFFKKVIQNQFASIPLLPPLLARTLHKILPVICHPKIDLVGLCLVITNMMFGYDHGQITKVRQIQNCNNICKEFHNLNIHFQHSVGKIGSRDPSVTNSDYVKIDAPLPSRTGFRSI